MFVITGATGNTGNAVAEHLLQSGHKVRVIGRSQERLQSLADQGAEAFVCKMEDRQALALAFDRAQAVYAMIPPDFQAPKSQAYQQEITDSLAEAIKTAQVKHAVFLSSIGAHHESGMGLITGLHHAEKQLAQIDGLNLLILRPGYFMENLFMIIPTIKNAGIAGTPVRGDIRISMIATRDIGDYAARRMMELDFSGHNIQELLGQRDLTLEEVTRVLGAAIGKPDLHYVQFPANAAEQELIKMGASPDVAHQYLEMVSGFNRGRLVPEESRSAKNTTPTSIEDFARIFAGAFNASKTL